MKSDTKYLLKILGISTLTAFLIYAIPTICIVEFIKGYLNGIALLLFFIILHSLTVLIINFFLEKLMNRLLLFYGKERLRKILEERRNPK